MKYINIIFVVLLLNACTSGHSLPQNSDGTVDSSNVPDATVSPDSDAQDGYCGNHQLDPNEECDTSNLNEQDCTSFGFAGGHLLCIACVFDTSACWSAAPVCGNGVLEAGEECDDGNQNNSDDCLDGPGGSCKQASCGDGFLHVTNEQCDSAIDPNCYDDCSGFCGDGLVHDGTLYPDHGEECDGSADCTPNCTITTCGDGYCAPSEQNNCVADCGCPNGTVDCGTTCCPDLVPGAVAGQCCGTGDCVVYNGLMEPNCGSCGNYCDTCSMGQCG